MINQYKAILFDFDGVICESNEVKTQAFKKLFSDYPAHMERILAYHKVNGGISRFRKFSYIYSDILNKALDEEEAEALGKKFSRYVYDAVVASPYVPGAYEFLEKHHRELPLFIVSGTPQKEIISIVRQKRLDRFFRGVYGSPATKSDIIRRILRENMLRANDIVFVGDTINDVEGARKAGIEIIGRIQEDCSNPFKGADVKVTVKDMTELETILKMVSA